MGKIIELLKEKYPAKLLSTDKPFEGFVRTILSQNTNDKNRDRAFFRLKEFYKELTPEKLARADLSEIESLIQVAGLHRIKSVRIHEISKNMVENYGGKIEKILNLPYKEARKKLLELKGIGFKTADIMLLFYCDHPFIPVDTHITRVSKRLGVAKQNASYESIRENLEGLITRDSLVYKESHLLLIQLGRNACKAINPRCDICVVASLCPKLIMQKVKKKPKKSVKKKSKKKSKRG